MNLKSEILSPWHQLPITLAIKAMRQKVYRQIHCIECGWPIGDITDRVLIGYDGENDIERYDPNNIGLIEVHCGRKQCRQYYRYEVAV